MSGIGTIKVNNDSLMLFEDDVYFSNCRLIILLAGWFPQITCRRHKVYTTTLFTLVFQVHSITDLVQQLYTAGKFYPHAKSLPRSVYKHGVIRYAQIYML